MRSGHARARSPLAALAAVLLAACGGATDGTSGGGSGTAAADGPQTSTPSGAIPVGGAGQQQGAPAATPPQPLVGGTEQSTGEPDAGGLVPADLLQLDWVSVRDPLANGMEAMRVLMPPDWNFYGGIDWHIGYVNGGVTRDMEINDPEGLRGVQWRPSLPMYWQDPPSPLIPEGGFYRVVGSNVERPRSAAAYIQDFVVPTLPNGRVSGPYEQMTEVAAAAQAYLFGGTPTDAARVRVTFTSNGLAFEGEIHAWTLYSTTQQSGSTVTLWAAERTFMIYAPVGELDALAPRLYPLVLSEVVNPAWQEVITVVEQLRQAGVAQDIRASARFSQIVSNGLAASFAFQSEAWQRSNAANDRMHESYVQYVRGVETYADPVAGAVELPGTFGQVWSNSNGTYLLSDDVRFDPNALPGTGGGWALLDVVR